MNSNARATQQIGTARPKCPSHPNDRVQRRAAHPAFKFANIGERKVGALRQSQLADAFLLPQFADGLAEMKGRLAGVKRHPSMLAFPTTIDYKL